MEHWKFYTQKTAWQLKTLLTKRNLFFFTPYKNFFIMTFISSDKAVSAVEKTDIPAYFKRESSYIS